MQLSLSLFLLYTLSNMILLFPFGSQISFWQFCTTYRAFGFFFFSWFAIMLLKFGFSCIRSVAFWTSEQCLTLFKSLVKCTTPCFVIAKRFLAFKHLSASITVDLRGGVLCCFLFDFLFHFGTISCWNLSWPQHFGRLIQLHWDAIFNW